MSEERNGGLTSKGATELTEVETLKIDGGIALLLPAVQKAREAATNSQSSFGPAYKKR